MGMAASQARLLSITSRMSDNELRAQLINNAKIRLTEDSSKASEKYISALNQTQLMMSNKDAAGNDLYQQLTFNNLTAYSSYNNQYGLINKSGEMVVSELDAAKYEQAIKAAEANDDTDALTEFLKQYGLEKDTTSYWESNGLDDDLKARYEGDIEYDANGNRVSGLHYGYEMSKTSQAYGIYEQLLDDYTKADDDYTSAVIKQMKEFLYSHEPSGFSGKNYETMYTAVNKGTNISESQDALNFLEQLLNELVNNNQLDPNGDEKTETFYDNMQYLLNDTVQFNGSGGATVTKQHGITQNEDGSYNIGGMFTLTSNGSGGYTVTGNTTADGVTYNVGSVSGNTFTYSYTQTKTNEDGSTTTTTKNGSCTFDLANLAAETTEDASEREVAIQVQYIYKYFNSNILSLMNRDAFANNAPTEKAAFEAAAKQLSIFIFGYDIGSENYGNLDDMEWIIYESGIPTTNLDSTSTVTINQTIGGVEQPVEYQTNFEAVKDVYLIENMIAEYGAPKYTWIDRNNPDENAEAKAQWYTNIFNKMNEDGYQTISQELASSSEWIQYAFESGLLSMIQVDDEFNWVSTMYSNCSDITEDTIDLLVTQAEAEYTRETNKIQAKDKLYDLELKNIDTEHEALQTEYDSIKSALDKNVERMFKYFS